MSKGIRPAVNAKFIELAPKRLEGGFGPVDAPLAKGNTEYRRSIMQFAMSTFNIGVPSAATAYNNALKTVRVSHPDLCVNLGRPEDKKGGRKPGIANNAATPPAADANAEQPPAEAAKAETPGVDANTEQPAEQLPASEPAAEVAPEQPVEETPAVTLYSVVRVKDDELVACDLTKAEADELIAANKKAKKAALKIAE